MGNKLLNNTVHDCPHQAISYNGTNIEVAYNEVYDAVKECSDAGAMYSGRDWRSWERKIHHNYFHDISRSKDLTKSSVPAVYEDDTFSGNRVYENLFENCDMAILTGGVHDNGFYDNVLINCKKSIQYDASAKKGGWAEALVLTDGGVYESFQTFIESGVNTELWCKTFPGFSELFEKFKIKQKYYSGLASGATDLKDVDLGIPTNAKIYGNSHYGEYIWNDNYYDVCDDVLKSADVKLDDEIKSKTLPESIEKSGYGSTDTEVP